MRGVCKIIMWGMVIGLMGICPGLAEEPVKLVFVFQDVDNFPYEVGENETVNAQTPGLSIELLQLVAQRLQISFEFKRLPWKRCFIEMQKGTVDGVFSASFKPERLAFGAYPMQADAVDASRRIYTMSYMLYVPTGSALRWDGNAFAPPPKKIAVIRGYSVIDDLSKMGIPVEEVKNSYVALKWLNSGMFDAAALLELSGDAALAAHTDELSRIEKLPIPLITRDYYLMLSRQRIEQSPKLAEDIWNAMKVVRESEEFQRIVQQYGKEERSE